MGGIRRDSGQERPPPPYTGRMAPKKYILRALLILAQDDDVRRTAAAIFFFLYLAVMVVFLALVPIPEESAKTVHLIIGGLVGGGIGPATRALLDRGDGQKPDLEAHFSGKGSPKP